MGGGIRTATILSLLVDRLMIPIDWATGSTIANIVLSLLLFFQWVWDRSRERAVKNGVFAARRIISRIGNDSQATAALDTIDAALATMGSRRPFKKWVTDVADFIQRRSKEEENEPLTSFPVSFLTRQSLKKQMNQRSEIKD